MGAVGGASGDERIHDVTTSLETEIPYSATRVVVLYKLNNAFAASTRRTRRRLRIALRFARHAGAAVHELPRVAVGNARRRPQPVPRIARQHLRLRRAPRRPAAEALVGGLTVKF
jgi:hypothetical protein